MPAGKLAASRVQAPFLTCCSLEQLRNQPLDDPGDRGACGELPLKIAVVLAGEFLRWVRNEGMLCRKWSSG